LPIDAVNFNYFVRVHIPTGGSAGRSFGIPLFYQYAVLIASLSPLSIDRKWYLTKGSAIPRSASHAPSYDHETNTFTSNGTTSAELHYVNAESLELQE